MKYEIQQVVGYHRNGTPKYGDIFKCQRHLAAVGWIETNKIEDWIVRGSVADKINGDAAYYYDEHCAEVIAEMGSLDDLWERSYEQAFLAVEKVEDPLKQSLRKLFRFDPV